MPEKPNNERPADLAVQDSVGGMATRLLNPAHLRDLATRSVHTLQEHWPPAAYASHTDYRAEEWAP